MHTLQFDSFISTCTMFLLRYRKKKKTKRLRKLKGKIMKQNLCVGPCVPSPKWNLTLLYAIKRGEDKELIRNFFRFSYENNIKI